MASLTKDNKWSIDVISFSYSNPKLCLLYEFIIFDLILVTIQFGHDMRSLLLASDSFKPAFKHHCFMLICIITLCSTSFSRNFSGFFFLGRHKPFFQYLLAIYKRTQNLLVYQSFCEFWAWYQFITQTSIVPLNVIRKL